jgi:NAD(P)-dependent dehydrogenase (short-subunit alcohol dehydrogenase family)
MTASNSLAGRVALVTGGSRGVGAGVARGLAEAGSAVALSYRRDAAAADVVVKEIRSAGGQAIAVRANAAVDIVTTEFGHVDLLVSNAGTASSGKTVLDTLTIDQRRDWERELINLYLERLAAAGGEALAFPTTWDLYRQQTLGALVMWTPTHKPPRFLPAMQPKSMTTEMLHRILTAIDDLESTDV